MQNKRKHHKQPQFYLKGFSTKCGCPQTPTQFVKQTDSIWVYKKGECFSENNPKCKGTSNVAFAKDFYAFVEEDGNKNFNKYEDLLMKKFEQPANSLIGKIRRFEDIDDEDKENLYNYVASMLMRGDYWKKIGDYAEEVSKPAIKSDIEKDVSAIVTIAKKQGDSRYIDANKLRKLFTDHIETEGEKRKKGEYEKSLMVRFAERFKDEILKNLNFKFLVPPNYLLFFTSDNPVCYTSFNKPQAQLLFPISSKVCLIIYKQKHLDNGNWKRKSNQFWQIDDKTVEKIRDFIVRKAINEVYFSKKSEWLVKFINNRN